VVRPIAALTAVTVLFSAGVSEQSIVRFSSTEQIAPGISYYTLDDPSFLGHDAAISIRALELPPEGTRLDLELGKDGAQGRDTVLAMARRREALAAVNAGFFGASGDPSGILKRDGILASDTARPRGAVAFMRPEGAPLRFDRVTARARVDLGRTPTAIAGVDTARGSRALVLYTPRYGPSTRTGGAGIEWTLEGAPLRVTRIARSTAASPSPSPIPPAGFVLSASGAAPPALARLKRGDAVPLSFAYATALGTPASDWHGADDIVGGAGLLLWRGREVDDAKEEALPLEGFVNARHPRTLIGRDRDGDTWLVVVDGRQPGHSVGMTLPELRAFAQRAGFVDALNLDGGGSTTMVVKGAVVNRPSDPLGLRPVSDAIVVLRR
jgi:hypothetical protein